MPIMLVEEFNIMNEFLYVMIAYAPWLELGFGLLTICAVYEFFFDGTQ